MVARDDVEYADSGTITSSAQRIGVLRRMPDRAKRGRAVVRSNALLASIGKNPGTWVTDGRAHG